MSGSPEDASLIALAAAVSDGCEVDWDNLERQAGTPERHELVRQLRQVALVAAAHTRNLTDSQPGATEPAPAAVAPKPWRHLVLFEAIGAGAFGTVYRGWDPHLDREVAVKLLPKKDDDSSPLAEARHLARIRHSNVVIVYGADEDEEQVGIWMEYIDGRTLAQMIREGGPMSAREVIGIGSDLSRAMTALHAAGLLHRDIKAQNVMRETGGRTVLMDFSGAEVVNDGAGAAVLSGTPLYMAPELLAGESATIRTDVYSLGVLLFYLLSGRLPVEGPTLTELRQAHLGGTRNRLRDLRPDLPDGIVQVVERATAPQPSARYQTAGDVAEALASVSGSQSFAVGTDAERGRKRTWLRRPGIWIGATTVLALVAAAAIMHRPAPNDALPVHARFTIGPPFTTGSWPRISPDGQYVAFGTILDGRKRFWIRALDSVDGHALMPTTATESPFWSPDSRTLAFFADGKLKTIDVAGGEPQTIADAPDPRGGDWDGDTIIFTRTGGIHTIQSDGTGLTLVVAPDRSQGDFQIGWPVFLHDGRRFLYVLRSSREERRGIYVGSLEGDPPRRLMPAYSRVAVGSGHLLFVREGTLYAQPFDAEAASLSGQPVALAQRIRSHSGGDGAFDVSHSGVLIYGEGEGPMATRLMLVDRRGRDLRALTDVSSYRDPRFSPRAQRIVATRINPDDNNIDIWLYGVDHPSAVRLTNSPSPEMKPVWFPDGKRIAFSSRRGPTYQILTKTIDTTEPEQVLVESHEDKLVEDISSDGRYLAVTVLRSGLWVFPVDQSQKPRQVRMDPRPLRWQASFSPDRRWLAYMSQESGSPEVYVEPFPGTGERWQVSTNGGAEPRWRADAKELYYLGADNFLKVVTVPETGWQNIRPKALFAVSVPDLDSEGDYFPSPDGKTFVVNTFLADPVVPPIDVVMNWPVLLARNESQER